MSLKNLIAQRKCAVETAFRQKGLQLPEQIRLDLLLTDINVASAHYDSENSLITFCPNSLRETFGEPTPGIIEGVLAEEFGHLSYDHEERYSAMRKIHTLPAAYLLIHQYNGIKRACEAGFRPQLRTIYKLYSQKDFEGYSEAEDGLALARCLRERPVIILERYPGYAILDLTNALIEAQREFPMICERFESCQDALLNPETYKDEGLVYRTIKSLLP